MGWKRDLLSSSLRFSGALNVLSHLHKNNRDRLAILAYHRIGGPVGIADYPFDHDLVSATAKDFEWQMRYVRRHFNAVTFSQVVASLEAGAALPPRAVIVSFDDGFDDNYRVAFPILKQLGVPATLFVATGYLGQPKTFWFDRVVYLVKNTSVRQLNINLKGAPVRLDNEIGIRYQQAIDLAIALRAVGNDSRLEMIELIEKQLGNNLAAESPLSLPMTWDMVAEMAAAGIEIGSHTVTHPNLVQMEPSALGRELTVSRLAIEEHTGQKPVVIAYPVGDRLNFNDEVIKAVKTAGYSLAASYISGVNPLNNLDRFALTRLHVESYTGTNEFAATLELPGLFG